MAVGTGGEAPPTPPVTTASQLLAPRLDGGRASEVGREFAGSKVSAFSWAQADFAVGQALAKGDLSKGHGMARNWSQHEKSRALSFPLERVTQRRNAAGWTQAMS